MSTYLLDIIIVEYTTCLKDVIVIMYNNVIRKHCSLEIMLRPVVYKYE